MKASVKLAFLAVILSANACITPSKITYIKDMEYGKDYPAKPAPELRIQKGDQLSIQVFSSDAALAVPFNTGALTSEGVGVTRAATYIVDSYGEIDFPVLGRLPLEGLTLKEVQNDIANRIINLGYIKEPVVSVNLENFTVTVVKYGTSTRMNVTGRSINLLQVVAPDRNEKIKEVEVIRTENGQRRAYSVDFQTIAMFDSPVFYLQQNDIIYVKPSRWYTSQTMSTIRSSISSVLSLVSTAASIMVWAKLADK